MDQYRVDNRDEQEMAHLKYLDDIGIEPISQVKFGRERGLTPSKVSESQQKAINKLASKLMNKSDKPSDDNEVSLFDVLSKPRIILYEGKVVKRHKNSLVVQQSSTRYLYLLNDVLIATKTAQSSSKLGLPFATEKYVIKNVYYLDKIAISDLSWNLNVDNSAAFEIITSDRTYEFVAESESDKRIWMEELQSAIFSVKLARPNDLNIGWIHEVVLGSVFSASYFGDLELLTILLERTTPDINLEDHDQFGMSALHWAALQGQLNAVKYLVNKGAKVDNLNKGLNTPMMLAASQGYDDIVSFLIQYDADVHIRNLRDRDALFLAVLYADQAKGLYNTIRCLIDNGVNVNEIDSSGSSPLHECASRNLSRSILLLVDAGGKVNSAHTRNGLTPLQLACNVPKPDVETIRSLLDKGVYPNFIDANKRSAFDMILATHTLQFNVQKALSLSTTNPEDLKVTVDEVASFVQDALPSLMELVRKGARYSEEALSSLRPSFREAILSARSHWTSLKEDEHFSEYVNFLGSKSLIANEWVDDKDSQYCQLCVRNYSISFRRHHCRSCGVLCCDLCSSKRLKLSPANISDNTSKHSKQDSKPDRVCDSCFNRLTYESFSYHQEVIKNKKELEKKTTLEKELAAAASQISLNNSPKNNQKTFFSGWSSSNVDNSPVLTTTKVASTLSEAAVALEQRGQRIEEVADKSELMREAASEYHKMAKQLLLQQQKKHW